MMWKTATRRTGKPCRVLWRNPAGVWRHRQWQRPTENHYRPVWNLLQSGCQNGRGKAGNRLYTHSGGGFYPAKCGCLAGERILLSFDGQKCPYPGSFTGTGTFIVRLLQLGWFLRKIFLRKYKDEIHANEIVLLAYYIASINIESTYHALVPQEPYTPFEGICLTDTFQLGENGSSTMFTEEFPVNSKRVEKQMQLPIRVILVIPHIL